MLFRHEFNPHGRSYPLKVWLLSHQSLWHLSSASLARVILTSILICFDKKIFCDTKILFHVFHYFATFTLNEPFLSRRKYFSTEILLIPYFLILGLLFSRTDLFLHNRHFWRDPFIFVVRPSRFFYHRMCFLILGQLIRLKKKITRSLGIVGPGTPGARLETSSLSCALPLMIHSITGALVSMHPFFFAIPGYSHSPSHSIYSSSASFFLK